MFLTVLCMGGLGMFVLLPIACIQWTWNSLMPSWGGLPVINAWQASLLYVAAAVSLFLSGLIRIEFEAEKAE